MPKYTINASNATGKTQTLHVTADDTHQAVAKVADRGWKIDSIDGAPYSPPLPAPAPSTPVHTRISYEDIATVAAALLRDSRLRQPFRRLITSGVANGVVLALIVWSIMCVVLGVVFGSLIVGLAAAASRP